MQPTLCDECGKPITSRARLEAGISFCSQECEFEDERKSCEKLGLQPSLALERYDEQVLQNLSEHISDVVLRDQEEALVELVMEDQDLADADYYDREESDYMRDFRRNLSSCFDIYDYGD